MASEVSIRTESGFKAGRADIMRALDKPAPAVDDFEADVNKGYSSEQRFGFYTSFSDFAHISLVFKGVYSEVYICKCRYTRGKLVLKSYKLSTMSQAAQKALKSRVGLMQNLMAPAKYQNSCNDLVRSFGFFEEQGQIVFVLEYCARGDVAKFLTHLRVPEANIVIEVVQPVLRCLQHLHSYSYVHGSIQPENLLLTGDGFVKVTDLDCTCVDGKDNTHTRLQTPQLDYMSPEIVRYHFPTASEGPKLDRKDNPYTTAADVWAIGILVYELLSSTMPFSDTGTVGREAVMNTAKKILTEDVTMETGSRISSEAFSFVRFALQKDPKMRPTADDLMLHPWIQKFATMEVDSMFDTPAPTFEEYAGSGQRKADKAALRTKVGRFFKTILKGKNDVEEISRTTSEIDPMSPKNWPEPADV